MQIVAKGDTTPNGASQSNFARAIQKTVGLAKINVQTGASIVNIFKPSSSVDQIDDKDEPDTTPVSAKTVPTQVSMNTVPTQVPHNAVPHKGVPKPNEKKLTLLVRN